MSSKCQKAVRELYNVTIYTLELPIPGVTQNVSLSSVQGAVVTREIREGAKGLSSSGTVALTSRAGETGYHGEAFGFFRDSGAGFAASP